ncbi:hypothetical protein LOD75_03245 [Xylella fastidiosa subsp. multiplex]|uniref:hypothetical protein n=1 Tax=Xylella fastidiosa TaxID=2371 RepID=UPI001F3A8555|nr:hypothetical protein [Xylella fastidiosa]MDD0908966.1 hypothetical protein [Xylella fastidiosa subsp. multiplex]
MPVPPVLARFTALTSFEYLPPEIAVSGAHSAVFPTLISAAPLRIQGLNKPKPASLSDIDAPTAEERRPIPVVFGTVLLHGSNVLWYGDLEADPIKKKGGKN